MRWVSMTTAAVCLTLTVGLSAAHAVTCSRKPLAQTQPAVDSFKARPAGLLDRFPTGESALSNVVSSVVSADPDGTLDKALELLRAATLYQRRAIGTGLGRAAQLCQQNGQSEAARRMAEALRRRSDRDAIMAFTAVSLQDNPVPSLPTQTDDPTPNRSRGRAGAPETRIFENQPIDDPLRPIVPSR